MNDIRRTILWVVFGFSMVLLWDKWQIHNGHAPTFLPSTSPAAKPAAQAAPAPASLEIPSANGVTLPVVPGATQPVPAVPVAAASAAIPRKLVVVSTDVLKITFDSDGGTLVRTEFLAHRDMADKGRNFVLLDSTKEHEYVAQSGMIGATAADEFPTHKTPMEVDGARDLKDGEDELVLTFTSAEVRGVKLVKRYTLRRGAYAIAVRHELTNNSSSTVAPLLYLQLVRDGNKPL